MKIIIFDFEVFKYDTLLGALVIDDDKIETYQSWNLDSIRDFYIEHQADIWIGWNNTFYDNLILQAVVKGKNEVQIKKTSDDVISRERRHYLDIPLIYYDLMAEHMISLKAIECAVGKNISTSEVDFNLNRPLTDEEKTLTESYNRDDLDQTYDNFKLMQSTFMLRLDVIKEFKLPLDALHVTGTQLAEMVLHAKKIDGIENWYIKPQLYPQLQVKNQEVIDFYLSEKFRKKGENKLTVNLCGVPHQIGSGGIHAARKKYSCDWAFYFDVSGYYNLVMINYDLLPRSIPDEYKALYKFMYEEQLRLKKTDPNKRWVYKIILLSVFGAMTNAGCNFYDPNRGTLVTMTGEIFLVDLLEKLDGKVELVQSNTDGIIARPAEGVTEDELKAIIDEWQTRTGFVLKLEKIYDIHQRDVNCYMYRTENGKIKTLGEAVKHYDAWDNPFAEDVYMAKEPVIIEQGIVDYFMKNKRPEETVKENMKTLRMFQYVCKKLTFDWMQYELYDKDGNIQATTKLHNVTRAFAMKDDDFSGMIYKCKEGEKSAHNRVQNLPPSVFVYDNEILSDEAVNSLTKKIDYDYYVDRIYERLTEFINFETVKGIKL